MANDNAVFKERTELDFSYDIGVLESLEESLLRELNEELADLEILKEEKEKIGNPDALGKVILDEVWTQFGNQIGLDVTNETLIQKYDREHPESYSDVEKTVRRDKKYTDAVKNTKKKQAEGTLEDAYTGKKFKKNDSVNTDHVVSIKIIYNNQRRKQAGIATEKLANKDANLQATNESLNKSKGATSIKEYLKKQEQRKKDLKEQYKKKIAKINASDKSEAEKRQEREKVKKRYNDKISANAKKMKAADKKARRAINRDIFIGATKNTIKKAGSDALKMMTVQALMELLKEVIKGLVRFFKSKAKSFNEFLKEMKASISAFVAKIGSFIENGLTTAVGTIVSEIFGPIVSMFKKLASMIKQGVSSLKDAIKFLRDPANKNIPFGVKMAQIGKIVVGGSTVVGAMLLSELIEKGLLSVMPSLGMSIPGLGSVANIIGLFLGSLVCGVIGAILINVLDKLVAEKQRADNVVMQIEKGNNVLVLQHQVEAVKEMELAQKKMLVASSIQERHRTVVCEINGMIEESDKRDSSLEETQESIRALLEDLEGKL